jgi:ADP-heptose:LPS heptosyltransferase
MKLEQPINILVQRRAAIGDVIMTTGIVRELKRRYGTDANIDIATDFAEPYRNNPHIRNVFPVDQVPNVNGRWDLYYNLDNAYELNPTEHYVKNYFYRVFGDVNLNRGVELFPNVEDKSAVQQLINNSVGERFIVVHMRNWYWSAKNISMDVWLEVFGAVFEQRADFKIVCVGGTTDFCVDHPLFVDQRGKLNSQQIKYLCDHALCFVGIDSGPFHCAAASDTHIIGLFTHLRPECIMPQRHLDDAWGWTAIPTLEDCRGCNDDQVRPVSQLVCRKGSTPCNNNFDTEAIADAILAQL